MHIYAQAVIPWENPRIISLKIYHEKSVYHNPEDIVVVTAQSLSLFLPLVMDLIIMGVACRY